MAKDPQAELERLGRLGEERERKRRAALAPPRLTPQEEKEEEEALRRRSLAEPGWGDRAITTATYALFVVILVAVIAWAWLAPVPEPYFTWVFLAGFAAAWVAACVLAPQAADALVAGPLERRQLRRLQQLPFAWDREGYLAELARQRKWATLRIECVVSPPCDAPTRALFIKAGRGLLPKMKAKVHEARDGTISLILTLEDLDACVILRGRYGRVGAYFTNAAIHDVFSRVAFKLLPQVEAVCPIVRVMVTVEGEVVPLALSPEDVGR